jgi:hypothetical protein
MTETCSSCRFADKRDNNETYFLEFDYRCKYNPPIVSNVDTFPVHPLVSYSNFCSKWEKRDYERSLDEVKQRCLDEYENEITMLPELTSSRSSRLLTDLALFLRIPIEKLSEIQGMYTED